MDGKGLSVRQQRLRTLITTLLVNKIATTPLGPLVDITEVSVSRDIRNVTVWWELDTGAAGDDSAVSGGVALPSTWLRPPPLTKPEEKVDAWLRTNASQFRFALSSQLSLKVHYQGGEGLLKAALCWIHGAA